MINTRDILEDATFAQGSIRKMIDIVFRKNKYSQDDIDSFNAERISLSLAVSDFTKGSLKYMKDNTPKRCEQYEVEEGDLVVKKGKHEAKVHFVESLDINDDGQITSILLVDGRADMFFDSDCIDDFFNEYRLLVKKENLEEEI